MTTPAFAEYRKLAEKCKKSGFASLTDEEKWRWHATDYAHRRITLNVPRDVHTSPRDPNGEWFDEARVRDAEAMYRAEFASRQPAPVRRDADDWPNATPEQRDRFLSQEHERRVFCAKYLPTPSAERNADGSPSAALKEFAALCLAHAKANLAGNLKRLRLDKPTDIRATQEALGLSSKPVREFTADEMAKGRRELGLPEPAPVVTEAFAEAAE